MKVGIVGFAGAGKTTVFNALTGLSADTGFGGKDKANLGNIKVPDRRVSFLADIYSPKKTTFAEIVFVDVAGPEGTSSETGLEQRVVNHMREVDAIVHIVRDFDSPMLERNADAGRDLLDFDGEMVLTDHIQVETRLERLVKEGKKTNERTLMERLQAHLESGMPLRHGIELSDAERVMISGYQFLSLKPCIVLVNRADAAAAALVPEALGSAAEERGMPCMSMAASAEAEIAELDAEDQKAFLADLGLDEPARDRFVQTVYGELELISFLTSGDDECRAWTVKKGTKAPVAAGKIHSDIERGFIRAEVTAFADFEAHGSEAKCREAGKLRLEGKEYVVQDGDIINFRFNV